MKKQPRTPRSKIRAALRALWLRSRERTAAIKREENCCEECGKKGSKAKGREVDIEVHHLCENGIDWNKIIEYIQRHLLCDPKELAVLCKDCHGKIHRRH